MSTTRGGRRVGLAALSILAGSAALVAGAGVAGAAGLPLSAATETSSDSWAVLPMGQLGNQANTFWQLLHAEPGSSHWASVTPQGVADNGGIVAAAGVAGASITVGFLPSQLLRFSPLSVSTDSGHTWNPAFLPGALAASPSALASGPDGSLAIVGDTVLYESSSRSAWARIVSLATFRGLAPRCSATALDAVAVEPTGGALVGASCHNGEVGLFTESEGVWHLDPAALPGVWRNAGTAVIRLQSNAGQTTALVAAGRGGRQALFALSQSGTSSLRVSAPLSFGAGSTIRASAVDPGGALSVLVGSKRSPSVAEINPDGRWVTFPPPPIGTLGLAWVVPSSISFGGTGLDAFTVVKGTELHVFVLTPAGTKWVPAQTLQVPLAYGSSS
jgi:hypothetical protein